MEIVFVGNWTSSAVIPHLFTEGTVTSKLVVAINFFDTHSDSQISSEPNGLDYVTETAEVLEYLFKYNVTRIPWRLVTNSDKQIISSEDIDLVTVATETDSAPSLSTSEVFTKGIEESNESNFCNAMKYFEIVLKNEPTNRDALFNISSLFHMHGYPLLSLPYVEKLLLLHEDDMVTQSFLWALAQQEEIKPQVIQCYQRLSELGNVMAQHKLAVLTGEGKSTYSVNPEYPKRIFDDMAPMFEKRLVQDLGYNCPWKMRELIDKLLQSSQITHPRPWRIVDLGCGSGLCGRLFCNLNETNESPPEAILCHDSTLTLEDALQSPTTAPASSPLLLGIDISSQMVELSRQNGGYSHVYCDDLRSSLTRLSCSIQRNETNPMNLIISADTFLYVGLLGEIFSLIHQCLSVSGIFLFSTEQLENSPMKLARGARGGQDQREGEELRKFEPEGYAVGAQMLSSGRFAHSHSYILALVEMCGFSIVHIEDIIVRTEVSIPLPGKIYVAQKVTI